MKDNTPKVTLAETGEKPTYEQLEDAYIFEKTRANQLEEAFKQSQDNCAYLRLQVKRLTDINKKLEDIKA